MNAGTWIYRKLFHDPRADGAGSDRLLVELVAPLAEELDAAGRTDRFFFLRYAEEGPHLRVRFRVPRAADPHQVAAVVDGSARRSPLVTRVAPGEYEPETRKHGGPAGQEIAERHFAASSRCALACIRRTLGRPHARTTVAAWFLDATLRAVGLDGPDRALFVAQYADHWRTFARAVMGAPVAEPRLAAEDVAVARALVARRDPSVLAAFVEGVEPLASALDLELTRLTGVARAGALNAPLAAVVFNLVHTFHNRLGLSLSGEVLVANLLSAVAAAGALAPGDGGGGGGAEIARLLDGARAGRGVVAVLDDPDHELRRGLSRAAELAGVPLHEASAGASSDGPFALVHAVAAVHPAGATLAAALERLAAAHGDHRCPLPPDALAVAAAFTGFLAAETRGPAVLALSGADAADADTLEVLLFLARAVPDLPLSLLLVPGRRAPGHPAWPAFLAELATQPHAVVRLSAPPAATGAPAGPPSLAAAATLVRAGALRAGATALGAVLGAPGALPAPERARALLSVARATLRAQRPAVAEEAARAALALGLPADHQATARRVRLAALHGLGDEGGLAALRPAVLADAERGGREGAATADRAWALLDAALVTTSGVPLAEHERWLDTLLALPAQDTPPQCRLAAHAWRAAAHAVASGGPVAREPSPEPDVLVDQQARALALADELGDFSRALFLRVRLAASLAATGEPDRATTLFAAAAEGALRAGQWELAALAAQHALSLSLVASGPPREPALAARWFPPAAGVRARVWTSRHGALAAPYLQAERAFLAGELPRARQHLDGLAARLEPRAGVEHRAGDDASGLALLACLVAHLEGDLATDRRARARARRRAVTAARRVPPVERRFLRALLRARAARPPAALAPPEPRNKEEDTPP